MGTTVSAIQPYPLNGLPQITLRIGGNGGVAGGHGSVANGGNDGSFNKDHSKLASCGNGGNGGRVSGEFVVANGGNGGNGNAANGFCGPNGCIGGYGNRN